MNLDEYRVKQWHETFDLLIKLAGPEQAVRAMIGGVLARANANGVPHAEIVEILGQLTGFSGWYRTWARAAAARQQVADEAVQRGRHVTAREAFIQAAYRYFYGQLFAGSDREKEDGSRRMIECYQRAAPLLDPPAERVELPHRGAVLAGYLRVPSLSKQAPCLVMVGGADTVKEECHRWTEYFLDRGVATLMLDGPGQGETQSLLPMSADYEGGMSAARAWLQRHPRIDHKRIGLWGCSTGGYLAARAVALDAEFKLGVSVGGFYDARRFPDWSVRTQSAFMHLYWLNSIAETIEYVRSNITLEGYVSRIERPFLFVHGARDHLVPPDEIEDMARVAPDQVELWTYEDGAHAVWNKLGTAAPRTADWVAEHLQRAT